MYYWKRSSPAGCISPSEASPNYEQQRIPPHGKYTAGRSFLLDSTVWLLTPEQHSPALLELFLPCIPSVPRHSEPVPLLGPVPPQAGGRSPSLPAGDCLAAAHAAPSQASPFRPSGLKQPSSLHPLLFPPYLQTHSINLSLASSWMSDEEQPFLVFTAKFNPCFLCLVFLNQLCPSLSVFPSCDLSPRASAVPVKSWFASVLSVQILPVYFLYFWHYFWRN